jgi:hypothetical protein
MVEPCLLEYVAKIVALCYCYFRFSLRFPYSLFCQLNVPASVRYNLIVCIVTVHLYRWFQAFIVCSLNGSI